MGRVNRSSDKGRRSPRGRVHGGRAVLHNVLAFHQPVCRQYHLIKVFYEICVIMLPLLPYLENLE